MADAVSPSGAGSDTLAPIATTSPVVDAPSFEGTKHKLKISGQEKELDYAEMKRLAEKAGGADEVFRTSAEDRKWRAENEKELAKLKRLKDPALTREEFFELMGDNAYRLSEEAMITQMEWDALSPEQQRMMQLEWERDQLAREKAEREETVAKQTKTQQRADAVAFVDNILADAITAAKADGIPVDSLPGIAEEVIDRMLAFLENVEEEEKQGRTVAHSFNPKDAIKMIHQEKEAALKALIGKMEPKELKKLLSKEQQQALRSEQISNIWTPTPPAANKPESKSLFDAPTPSVQRGNVRMKTKDAFDILEKQLAGA